MNWTMSDIWLTTFNVSLGVAVDGIQWTLSVWLFHLDEEMQFFDQRSARAQEDERGLVLFSISSVCTRLHQVSIVNHSIISTVIVSFASIENSLAVIEKLSF